MRTRNISLTERGGGHRDSRFARADQEFARFDEGGGGEGLGEGRKESHKTVTHHIEIVPFEEGEGPRGDGAAIDFF